MEYQYYEFQALDRPLTREDKEYVSSLSSRTQPTSRQAIFTYSYGDFRADPLKVLARCFDALFYQANWGTTQLAFRFPATVVDRQNFEPYGIGTSVDVFQEGAYVILNISITDEDNMPGWIEPEGTLDGLLPLREEIMHGDLRGLYIAWLKAVQHDEYILMGDDEHGLMDEDKDEELDVENPPEPPVPPGLHNLSPSLHNFIDVFAISPDLVAVAAEASEDRTTTADDFAAWVPLLPQEERNAFLVRIAEGDAQAKLELIQRLREVGGVETRLTAQRSGQRRLNDLLQGQEAYARRRKEREQQEARAARQRELQALAPREEALWQEVYALIKEKKASPYDRATKLLVDLRDLAAYQQQQAAFQQRFNDLVNNHVTSTALLRRFREARLMK